MDLSVDDSLGQQVGNLITQWFDVPEHVRTILDFHVAGNTVMSYAFLAAAIVVGWFVSLMASFVVGRLLRLIFGRISKKFAAGVSKAIAGPIRISVLCWIAMQGTVFLVKPPAPVPVPAPEAAPGPGAAAPGPAAAAPSPAAAAPSPAAAAPSPAAAVGAAPGAISLVSQLWRPHWTYLALRGFFNVSLVLSLFWIVSRLLRFFWGSYLEPWIETSVRGMEKRYFGLAYRLIMMGLWIWAILSSIAALGFDTRDEIKQMLGYKAAHQSIGAYLSFLGLALLALLLGRTLFTILTKGISKIAARFGDEKINLEESWLKGLETPLIYLVTLIGFRLAATLTLHASDSFPNIQGIVLMAIHLCMTIVIAWIAVILIDKFFENIVFPLTTGSQRFDEHLVILARKSAKVGIGIIGFIFMLKSLGQDPSTVLAGLGIGGLAVSFAAKDTLSNFMAGLTIFASKPFRLHDFIILENQEKEGEVEEIGLRATIVRKRDGTRLIIPNDKLTTSVVENRTVGGRTKESIALSLNNATTPEKRDRAIQLFVKTVYEVEGAQDPNVDFVKYSATGLNLILSYWVRQPARLNVIRTSILLLIDARLHELGVEITALPTIEPPRS